MRLSAGIAALVLFCPFAPPQASPVLVDEGLRWVFPSELGGMAYERMEKYTSDALGYSIFYGRDSFKAVLSVLTLGREQVLDGPGGEGIDALVQRFREELGEREENGQISKLQKRGSAVVPMQGTVRFAMTLFQYYEGAPRPLPRCAALYATGCRNRFIQLEFRYDLKDSETARLLSDQMVVQLIDLMGGESSDLALLLAQCDAAVNDPSSYGGRLAARQVLAKTRTLGELNVYTDLFPWEEGYAKPRNVDLLMAAYFAGMLKVVVPAGLPSGGEYEAFDAMLTAYRNMRDRNDIQPIAKLEEWSAAPDRQALYQQLLVEFEYALPPGE